PAGVSPPGVSPPLGGCGSLAGGATSPAGGVDAGATPVSPAPTFRASPLSALKPFSRPSESHYVQVSPPLAEARKTTMKSPSIAELTLPVNVVSNAVAPETLSAWAANQRIFVGALFGARPKRP